MLKITSKDIAKLAGVSRSTVSRVVNNYPNVPEATKLKILEIIKKYNYVPNTSAQGLVGKLPKIIGLFIIDLFHEGDELTVHRSQILLDYVGYSSDLARKFDYNVLVNVIKSDEQLAEIERLLRNKTISGAIIMGDLCNLSQINTLADDGFKILLLQQITASTHKNIISVNFNNFLGAYAATQHLVNKNHKRISVLAGNLSKLAVIQKQEGFRTCLSKNNIPFNKNYLAVGSYHREEGGYKSMMEILKNNSHDLPTAVFCNSVMSIGALHAIRDFGLSVPEDISILAIDGINACKYTNPPISEIYLSQYKLISTAVSSLVELIENDYVEQNNFVIDDLSLIERESVREL